MLKIEVNKAVAEIDVDGSMEDIIPEAMIAIRTMYDFFKSHGEKHGYVFKKLLQKHAADGGVLFADEYNGKDIEGVEEDVHFKKSAVMPET